MSNHKNSLQTRVRDQIREVIEPKDLKEFESAVEKADNLFSAMETAKSKAKGIKDAAYAWGKSAMALWKIELELLETLQSGLKIAIDAQRDEILSMNCRKNEIIQDYRESRNMDQKGNPEDRQSRGDKNRELKAAALKASKEVDTKSLRLGPLADLNVEFNRAKTSCKALKHKSAIMWPMAKGVQQTSPLDSVDLVDQAILDWADKLEKSITARA